MIFQDYRDRTTEFLGKEFGPGFALAVARQAPRSCVQLLTGLQGDGR